MDYKLAKNTKIQDAAIKLLAHAKSKHVMLFGGSRSGKTFISIKAIIIRACKVKSRHMILRLNFNHVKTSIWLDTLPTVLKKCFPKLEVTWNKTDFYVTLPNGSEIWVGGLDDDKRVEKILGKEYSTIYFNECSQLSYKSIQVAITRLAEKNDLKKLVMYDMNPPTKKHWSYWTFIKKIDPLEGTPLDPEEYQSHLMNPMDNIENIDPDYLKLLQKMPEKERLRFMLGEFNSDDEGNAYYAFDREKNVMEVPENVRKGSKGIGMDFNVQPMTCVIGYYTNKIFYVTSEAFLENSDTIRMIDHLRKNNHIGGVIYPDSTGKNRKTSGKSDHQLLKEAGFTIPPVANPLVIDRVNNINRLLSEGRIIIDPSCKKLINDLEKVVWKNGDLDQKTDKLLTHISDALGYWCWALDRIEEESKPSQVIQL